MHATTLFTNEAIGPKELAGCCIRRAHMRMGRLYSSLSAKRPMPTNHRSLWARSGHCRSEPERVRTSPWVDNDETLATSFFRIKCTV